MDTVDVNDLLRAQTLVFRNVLAVAAPMSIKCAAELGIPDAVHRCSGGPVTLEELSAALPEIHPSKVPFLPHLMRLLVQVGFLTSEASSDGSEGYVLTPWSKLLVKSNPVSMADFLSFVLHPSAVLPWNHFSEWFKTEAPSSCWTAYGMSWWDYTREMPEINKLFNSAMAGEATLTVAAIVAQCRDVFEPIGTLVDIGGGTGKAARAIASAFPGIKCTVFDLPHVVAAVPAQSGGVEVVGGDMFEHIPFADALLLKNVLHDWNDEDCVKILKRCKEAIPQVGGKVILVEIVMNSGGHGGGDVELEEAKILFDLQMVMGHGAKERDESEWREIFHAAGFSSCKIKHVLGLRSIIELYP